MNGTLAIWYGSTNADLPKAEVAEGAKAGEMARVGIKVPQLQLHVNLWRDLDESFNFLDLGFLLSDAADLNRLYLYLPATVTADCIRDLGVALKDLDTLNAVFNEVAELGRETDDDFMVTSRASGSKLIHPIDPEKDLEIRTVPHPGKSDGTIVALRSDCCKRIAEHPLAHLAHYVRIRIFLRGDARDLFTSVDTAPGIGVSLAQDVLETTEFRLNEQRSYPPSILPSAAAGELRLMSVHYFLIRSRDYQLSSQHQTFRKARNLEDGIWDSYLSVGREGSPRRRSKSKGMIIYQWRETAEPPPRNIDGTVSKDREPLSGFTAFASFRTAQSRFLAYVIAALALGGVGSAFCNLFAALIGPLFVHHGWRRPPQLWTSLAEIPALLAIACVPAVCLHLITWWHHGKLRK